MSLIHNERVKLTANWLNAISAASIAVGGFAQLAPSFTGMVVNSVPVVSVFSIGWIIFGIAMHLVARVVLGGLRE
jgi:hypothetical protein